MKVPILPSTQPFSNLGIQLECICLYWLQQVQLYINGRNPNNATFYIIFQEWPLAPEAPLLTGLSMLWCVNLRELCFFGLMWYEYSVFRLGIQQSVMWVGHLGNSWDEWVGADRLMKHNEENLKKQEALDLKQGEDKNPKAGRSSQSKLLLRCFIGFIF